MGTRVHGGASVRRGVARGTALAAGFGTMPSMRSTHVRERPGDHRRDTSLLAGLLRGYRFAVCEDPAAVLRALAVRRSVYVGECGYQLAVPDEYDRRSWFLLAEEADSGQAVGSMRVTPRLAGPLEAEASFDLPPRLCAPGSVEVSRFAILPEARHGTRFLPAVALGLFKLAVNFVCELGASYAVVCSRPERVLSYVWLRFERSGLVAPYVKLGGAEHELLACDLRGGLRRYRDHRYWDFFIEQDHPQVVLPHPVPPLGLLDPAPGCSNAERTVQP